MSTTLTYGLKIPATGETMPAWCTILGDNATRTDGHSHNGTDSAILGSAAITKTTASILAVNWVATTGGTYRQLVTLPGAYVMSQVSIEFLDASGNPLLLTVEKASTTTYYVYVNDNTLALTAVYG